jgi:hypothetical protein
VVLVSIRGSGESVCSRCIGYCVRGCQCLGFRFDYEGDGLATVTLRALQRANSAEIKRWIPCVIEVKGKPEFVVERYEPENPYHKEAHEQRRTSNVPEGLP